MAERWGGRSIRRFYVVAAVYWLMETTAVLLGFRVVPYFSSSIPLLVVPSWFIGMGIEYWLFAFAGEQPSSESEFLQWNSRVMSKGSVYLLPPILAITGSVLGWAMWLSIGLFLVLMFRVHWVHSRRQPETSRNVVASDG